jgi:hypothetical protein
MTHPDEADVNDTWTAALRSDYEPAPRVARERIAARLAGAGLAAVAVGSAVAVAQAAPRGFLYSKALVVLATLPVGIVIGAAGHAWLARPAVVPVAVRALPVAPVAPVAVAAEPTPVAVEDPLPALEPLNPQPAAPKPRPSTAAPALETPGLEQELKLLEQARTKLSEGQPAATLEQLRQHRAQYPQSALEQEREALSVRALMATGRRAEAQKRAAAFVQRYPSSMLRGSVERAVGSIP